MAQSSSRRRSPASTASTLTLVPGPYADLVPPPSARDKEGLRASIEEQGVLDPIVVDEDGVIIDGHHRHQFATELGLPVPHRVVRDLITPEKTTLAIELNLRRRQLTAAQVNGLVRKMRDLGLSTRAIAEKAGISKSSVHRMVTSGVPSGTPEPGGGSSASEEEAVLLSGEEPPDLSDLPPTEEVTLAGLGDAIETALKTGKRTEVSGRNTKPKPEAKPVKGRDGKTYKATATKRPARVSRPTEAARLAGSIQTLVEKTRGWAAHEFIDVLPPGWQVTTEKNVNELLQWAVDIVEKYAGTPGGKR